MIPKILTVIYPGNSVNYMTIQVKYTVSKVENAFQRGFCQLTVYFFIQQAGTFFWSVFLIQQVKHNTSEEQQEKTRCSRKYCLDMGDGAKSKGKLINFLKSLSKTGVANKGE